MNWVVAINVMPKNCFSLAPRFSGDWLMLRLQVALLFVCGCYLVFKAVKERNRNRNRKPRSQVSTDGHAFLLKEEMPLFSRELVRPLRLASLAVGLALLIAGSIWLPSTDWDIPICFVMGLPAYVFAPWVFRQVWYFRWRWILPAVVALWFVIDGTYSAYWWLRGFDALAVFRPANYFYCIGIFWICGIVWNIDYTQFRWEIRPCHLKREEVGGWFERRLVSQLRCVCAVFFALGLSLVVAVALGFMN